MDYKSLTETRYVGKLAVSKHLGVCRTTVDLWRKEDPTFPKPIVFSRFVLRWDINEIEAWARAKKVASNER